METVSHDLLETIGDLTEVVKIKNEKSKKVTTVRLDKVLSKVENSLSEEIQNSGATITADFSSSVELLTSKTYLESIFLNLISNSLKYRNPEIEPKINIQCKLKGESLVISFEDNGLDIDLKKHGQKVFGLRKTFHRGKDSRGVGLFLTKAQVEAMGGSIHVESKPTIGSTFSINLPKSIIA